jgi:hypothetical protein
MLDLWTSDNKSLTLFKAYCLLYEPPGLTFKNCTSDYIAFMCFAWLSEETITFALYFINKLVFITEPESAYCSVRPEFKYNTDTFHP